MSVLDTGAAGAAKPADPANVLGTPRSSSLDPAEAILERLSRYDLKTGDPLARRVRVTYGIRFDAAERMRKIENVSLTAISLLTGYIIIGSAGQAIFEAYITEMGNKWLVFGILATSIIVLIISLTEAKARALNSPVHLEKNAQELYSLYSELTTRAAQGSLTNEGYNKSVSDYNELLTTYLYNQRMMDFEVFVDRNIALFPEKQKYPARAILKVRAIWAMIVCYFTYYAAFVGIPVLAIVVMMACHDVLIKPAPEKAARAESAGAPVESVLPSHNGGPRRQTD